MSRLPSRGFGRAKTATSERLSSPVSDSSPTSSASAVTAEHFKRLDGDFKSLRTQFREFHKKFAWLDPETYAVPDTGQLHSEMLALRKQQTHLRQEIESMRNLRNEVQSLQALRQDILGMKAQIERDRSAIDHALKSNESKLTKAVHTSVHAEVEKLGSRMGSAASTADLGTMQLVVANTSNDLQALKKQMYDSGVLAPKPEVVEHHHDEEKVPVGTIELGEFMFAARLLVKLGFEKAKQQRISEEAEAREVSFGKMSDSDGESSLDYEPRLDDLVSGISFPCVQEYGPGYYKVTYGWLVLSIMTLCVQMLMVFVIIAHSFRDASTMCVQKPRAPAAWWTLHVSKACAIAVAGALMGKEMMDNVHYWLVSKLLLPGSHESDVTVLVRVITVTLIFVASVISFVAAHDPASVFMNVTALSFIGEVGYMGLEIAKRGVFGHYIGKTMTNLNFQINLVSEYPPWFRTVRHITLGFTGTITVFCGVSVLFSMSEPVCEADGTAPRTVFTTLAQWLPSIL